MDDPEKEGESEREQAECLYQFALLFISLIWNCNDKLKTNMWWSMLILLFGSKWSDQKHVLNVSRVHSHLYLQSQPVLGSPFNVLAEIPNSQKCSDLSRQKQRNKVAIKLWHGLIFSNLRVFHGDVTIMLCTTVNILRLGQLITFQHNKDSK